MTSGPAQTDPIDAQAATIATRDKRARTSLPRRLVGWLGWIVLALVLLLVLVLALLWFAAGTDKGVGMVASQVSSRIDALELGSVSGNLTKGLDTDTVTFSSDTLELRVTGVDTDWRMACLASRTFCLDKAIIDELYIATTPDETTAAPESASDGIVLPAISLPIDITAEEVLIRKLRFQGPGEAPEQLVENIMVSLDTKGNKVVISNASASYQTMDVALSGDIQLDGDYPIDMTLAADLRDTVPGSLFDEVAPGTDSDNMSDLRVDLALSNTLAELVIGADISGVGEIRIDGQLSPLETNIPATLEIRSPALGMPIDTRSQLSAQDIDIRIDGTLDDYLLSIDTTVVGEQLPRTQLALEGQTNTERLLLSDIRVDTLGGQVAGSAAVSWDDGVTWLSDLSIADINPAVHVPDLDGKLDGLVSATGTVDDTGNWTLDLKKAQLGGVLKDYPFVLDGTIKRGADGVFRIDKLTLDNEQNQLVVRGTVSETWDVAASARLPQLQNIVPGLEGGFTAGINVRGDLTEPDAVLAVAAERLALDGMLVQGLSLSANIGRGALDDSTLSLTIDRAESGEQAISDARLNMAGTRARHQITLDVDGPQDSAASIELAGGLSEQFDWDGSLMRAELLVPAHTLTLREPARLDWNNRSTQLAVAAHCWVSDDATLCLDEDITVAESGVAKVSLDQYALSRLGSFMPDDVSISGQLDTSATVAWGKTLPGGLAVDADLAIAEGSATVIDPDGEAVAFRYDALTLQTTANPTDVEATLSVTSSSLGDATINVSIDPAEESRTISGDVNLQEFKLDFLEAFLPDFDEIAGVVTASGELSGELIDPRFDGEIVISDMKASAPQLPLALTGGRIVSNVRGNRAFLEGSLESGDEGRIDVDGAADWRDLAAWRADVTLTGSQLPIRSAPLTDSLVDHQITINARSSSIRVSGDVRVPYATIDVEDLPQGAETLSDDIVIIEDMEEDANEGADAASGDLNLNVAVDVAIGDDVSLDAYGLTANLTGEMGVALRSPNPVQLSGELRVVDGVYKQYGQNLEASGEILFVGPINQSNLAIEAIRRIDSEEPERIAGLKIGGTLDVPDVSLFTEPADKSEEAILSYIVLGRDLGETSDQSANLLATAALALSVKGGRSLGQNLADQLGVEDFALETRGKGEDTELVVSGRLNERLLLRYGQSIFDAGASTLYLRYDLSRKLYLEAAQSVINRAVDLIYQFSF